MGELLCHMWLLGLPCSLGGDEWLRDNIFYLFIRFFLMNKNRKCRETTVLPLHPHLLSKKKGNTAFGPNIKEFSISLFRYKDQRYFFTLHLWSITVWFVFFLVSFFNWTDRNVRHMGPFHTFSKYFLCRCVFRVQVQSSTGLTASAMESQVLFYPPKWDPFWCDIWENYQCMGEQGRG